MVAADLPQRVVIAPARLVALCKRRESKACLAPVQPNKRDGLIDVLHRIVVEPELRSRLAARLALVVEQVMGIANGAINQPEVDA